MTIKQLISYFDNPGLVDNHDKAALQHLCEQYPYFQQVVALYLKQLKDEGDIEYNALLKKAALQAPDREWLQSFMEKGFDKPASAAIADQKSVPVAETTTKNKTNTVAAKETVAENGKRPLPKRPGIRAMETEYKLDEGDISSEHKLKHQDLIDKFIADNPHISPVGQPFGAQVMQGPGSLDISYTDEDVTDSVFSESLARIYIKQKQYAKAIRIFEKLNLKYPEKSSYFADQIRFLEKVIDNA